MIKSFILKLFKVSAYCQLSDDTTSLNPPGCGVRQNSPQQQKIVGGYKAKIGGITALKTFNYSDWISIKILFLRLGMDGWFKLEQSTKQVGYKLCKNKV